MLEAGIEPVPGQRLKRRLGAGAFGEVWEAIDRDGNAIALKFLDARTRSLTLIRSEIRVLQGLSELDHPHIIRLLGVHASSRYIILSMERADGNLADLRAAYQEEAGLNIPPDHLLELLEQAADALDFLAGIKLPGINSGSRGLQHCDIKPTNLLLVGDSLKVADFGLCVSSNWHGPSKAWRGTPPYAAPELYHGAAALGTDQYALAVTFCELSLGERIFTHEARAGPTPGALPIDLARVRVRELPVFARALHPQPSARWPSCRAFMAALRAAVESDRKTPPKRRSRALRPVK